MSSDLNSLPGTLLRALAAEIEAAGKDDAAKVIVLKSEGEKAFCAGASFDELLSIKTAEEGKVFFSGFAAVINAIRKAPKFVLARVQGKAVGGGVGLACAADYTLAHEGASVKLSELAIGIGPFVVGPSVERKLGTSGFTTLTLNATEWQTAKWARPCSRALLSLPKSSNKAAARRSLPSRKSAARTRTASAARAPISRA